MKRNRWLAIILFLGIIPISCFKPKYPYYQILDISITSFKNNARSILIKDGEAINADTVFFRLNFTTQFLADLNQFNFTNSCMATTKPQNGSYGIKDDKITGITITSEKIFNGSLPQTLLNGLFKMQGYKTPLDIEEIKTKLNDRSPSPFPDNEGYLNFYMTQKANDTLTHTFKLTLEYEKGFVQTATTSIKWVN